MNKNFYIASRLAKISRTAEEDQRILQGIKEFNNNLNAQHEFYSYCVKFKLAPWIYIQLMNNNLLELFDPDIQVSFSTFYQKIKSENENRIHEAKQFLAQFKENNIDVAVLKGNLFISSIYKDIGYKKMNDFDMLIRMKDWEKVQDIYFKMGYIPLGFGWGGEKGKAAKFSHTGLSFISPNYQCITGTQWGLKSPTSNYTVNIDEIWNTSVDHNFHGIEIKKLSPEYNLLHLILHMGTYKCGIRDCMDVYNLLISEPQFNEDLFVTICKNSNALEKAIFTLQLSNMCCDSISHSLLEKLKTNKKSFLLRRLAARKKMAEKTGDMQNSYNDYFHKVEMTVFYFSLFHSFHRKVYFYLKLIKELFWPGKEIIRKLSDLDGEISSIKKLKARIKAPYFVFALLGEEIGVRISILLFFKMFFDTLFSIRNYFLKKDTYFEYLEKRGIDAKDIKKVVKGIQ